MAGIVPVNPPIPGGAVPAHSARLNGTIENTGTIGAGPAGGATTILIDKTVTLVGHGNVLLSKNFINTIAGDPTDGGTLINQDNTISGAGQIGNNRDGKLTLDNLAGTIDATNTTTALLIDTGNIVTNSALMEATGGGTLTIADTVSNFIGAARGTIQATGAGSTVELFGGGIDGGTVIIGTGAVLEATGGPTHSGTLDGATVTDKGLLEASQGATLNLKNATVNAAGGVIEANNGAVSGSVATVELAGTTINGGTLKTVAGGIFETEAGTVSTLNGVTISGGTSATTLNVVDNSTLTLKGVIANSGVIALNAHGDAATLVIDKAVTLTGHGNLTLSDDYHNAIVGDAADGGTLTNLGNTISGTGQIGNGDGTLTLHNTAGTITTGTTNSLTIDTGNTVTNTGLMVADGGDLIIEDSINNTGGRIEAHYGTADIGSYGGAFGFAFGDGAGVTLSGGVVEADSSIMNINVDDLHNVALDVVEQSNVRLAAATIDGSTLAASGFGCFLDIEGVPTAPSFAESAPIAPSVGNSDFADFMQELSFLNGGGTTPATAPPFVNMLGAVNSDTVTNGQLGTMTGGAVVAGALGTISIDSEDLKGVTVEALKGSIFGEGSVFLSGSTMEGGTLMSNTVGGPSIEVQGVVFDGTTSPVVVRADLEVDGGYFGGGLELKGTINNGSGLTKVFAVREDNNLNYVATDTGYVNATGTITLNAARPLVSEQPDAAASATLVIDKAVTLTGNGSVVMQSNSLMCIIAGDSTDGGTLTNNGNTVSGAGEIGHDGNGLLTLHNLAGTINANTPAASAISTSQMVLDTGMGATSGGSPVTSLTINTGNTLINTGLMEATNGGTLVIADSVNNVSGASHGTIAATGAGSIIDLVGGSIHGGVVSIGAGATLEATGGASVLSTIAGATVSNAGTLEATNTGGLLVQNAVANSGAIAAHGGNVTITGAVTGAGHIDIFGSDVVTLGSSATNSVNFEPGGNSELILNAAQGFSGKVTGFASTDNFDFTNFAFATTSITKITGGGAAGTVTNVTVTDSASHLSETLHLVNATAGEFGTSASEYSLSADSNASHAGTSFHIDGHFLV